MGISKQLFCISIFAILGCARSGDLEIDKVQLKELNGAAVDLSDYEGKTVFINVWATWCQPCIKEMPTILEAQKQLDDVVFLLASNEEPAQIEGFIKRNSYDFHYVRLENMEALGIQALPTTFIFGPEGKLKFSEAGFRVWNDPANIELINSINRNHDK
jgi:thiol-disulfide isomerase/thioredoxin